jgi:hypothetical protein
MSKERVKTGKRRFGHVQKGVKNGQSTFWSCLKKAKNGQNAFWSFFNIGDFLGLSSCISNKYTKINLKTRALI